MRTRAHRKVLVGSVALVVVVTATALSGCDNKKNNSSAGSSASPASGTINPTAARQQVTLPIKGGEHFYPHDVSVDAQGTVYGTSVNDGVLKLAPGAQAAVSVGFTGVQFGVSGGADAAGNVYLTDDGGTTPGSTGRVQKRTPAGAQTQLPFVGLSQDPRLAIASDGTVYVADFGKNRVLKLPPGATSPSELPFTGLNGPRYVAVDSAGNVYVSEVVYEQKNGNPRVLMLAAGATTQSVLPITAKNQRAIAVDGSGNVYLTGAQGVTVLAKGAQQTTQLPVSGAGGEPDLIGIAVDSHGNIYLADNLNDQFIELKT